MPTPPEIVTEKFWPMTKDGLVTLNRGTDEPDPPAFTLKSAHDALPDEQTVMAADPAMDGLAVTFSNEPLIFALTALAFELLKTEYGMVPPEMVMLALCPAPNVMLDWLRVSCVFVFAFCTVMAMPAQSCAQNVAMVRPGVEPTIVI